MYPAFSASLIAAGLIGWQLTKDRPPRPIPPAGAHTAMTPIPPALAYTAMASVAANGALLARKGIRR